MYNKIINNTDELEFINIIHDIVNNSTVQGMKKFRHHYNSTCFDHCLEVSYISYKICKKLNLDYKSAARAGLLHDLFLYDWRHSKKQLNLEGYHAFVHPKIALKNSLALFDLNKKEQDIILKHMWPVTFFRFPRYIESFIITFIDKYSALKSCKEYYNTNLKKNTIYKYAYVFFALIVINI